MFVELMYCFCCWLDCTLYCEVDIKYRFESGNMIYWGLIMLGDDDRIYLNCFIE